jgi:hypothetical protein
MTCRPRIYTTAAAESGKPDSPVVRGISIAVSLVATMKSSQAFWLSAAVGRSLASAYLPFEVCPWTPLQALELVSLPPAADHSNLNNTRPTPPSDHQDHGAASHAWVGPHYCVGGYCVWTNTEFMGRGTSIVTTRENYQRVLDRSTFAAGINSDAPPFNTTQVPGKGIGRGNGAIYSWARSHPLAVTSLRISCLPTRSRSVSARTMGSTLETFPKCHAITTTVDQNTFPCTLQHAD